jgi:hypothetical protein
VGGCECGVIGWRVSGSVTGVLLTLNFLVESQKGYKKRAEKEGNPGQSTEVSPTLLLLSRC